jgi:hypothetical protein
VAGTLSYTFTTFDFSGSILTKVYGVNDSGELVGYYQTAPGGAFNGFMGQIGGSSSTLNESAFTNTFVTGINDSGQIVGCVGTCGGPAAQANETFLYNGTSFTVFNPSFANTTNVKSQGAGINGSGLIVGSYTGTLSGVTGTHGYVDNAGTYSSFSDPNNANGTLVGGVNNLGQIVGFYLLSGVAHGYQTSTSLTSFTDLFDSADAQTFTLGIDSAGDVAGYVKDSTNGINHLAILSSGAWTVFDEPNAGIAVDGSLNGSQILGISPDGTKIVGDYQDLNGNTHGFYATLNTGSVPEPGTVLLSLSGIGLLAGWGWRRQRRASK